MAAVPHPRLRVQEVVSLHAGPPVVAPGNPAAAGANLHLFPPHTSQAWGRRDDGEGCVSPAQASSSLVLPLHARRWATAILGVAVMTHVAKSKDASATTSLDPSATFTPLAISCSFQPSSCGFGENIPRPHMKCLPCVMSSAEQPHRHPGFLTTTLQSAYRCPHFTDDRLRHRGVQ